MEDDGDDSIDDLVGQICSRLTNLKTLDKQQHIDAFIEVLECTTDEASFFLESSSWDIGTAVGLFLEEQQYSKRRATNSLMNAAGIMQHEEDTMMGTRSSYVAMSPNYLAKEVHIESLPEGWTAAVSPRSGQIVFFNISTMCRQYAVPPGFANPIPRLSHEEVSALEFSDNDEDEEEQRMMNTESYPAGIADDVSHASDAAVMNAHEDDVEDEEESCSWGEMIIVMHRGAEEENNEATNNHTPATIII